MKDIKSELGYTCYTYSSLQMRSLNFTLGMLGAGFETKAGAENYEE